MDPGFTRKLVKNTLVAIYARVAMAAIGLWLTPYVLGKVGGEVFGVWVLVLSLTNYVSLLDLGYGTSFVKYVAEYHTREDQEGVDGVLTTGLLVYVLETAVALSIAYPLINVSVAFFTIPPGMEQPTRLLLAVALCTFLLGNFVGVYQSIINGLQRMEVSNGITVLQFFWYAAGSVVALESGSGIVGLAIAQLSAQALALLLSVRSAYRLCPRLRLRPRTVKRHFLPLLRYGGNLQISAIAGLINFQFDKLLVNRVLDPSHVTFYEIGSRLPSILRSFPVLLLSALTPASAELEVRKGRAELYELFSRASKYVSIVACPIFAGALAIGQPFVTFWVGHGYDPAVVVLRLLAVGYLLNTLAGPVSAFVSGMGRPDYQRNAETLSLLLNLALSSVLILQIGFYGAPLGTAIAMSLASVYYLWTFHRFMSRPLLPFLKTIFLKPVLCSTGSGLAGLLVVSALQPHDASSRLFALLTFLAGGAVFLLSYGVLILTCRYLDAWDFDLIRRRFPGLRA